MKYFHYFLAAILFLLVGLPSAQATHIVGGEITYVYKGANKYEVKLLLFVDCINGQPGAILEDKIANIGIFKADTFVDSFTIVRTGPARIDNTNYTCIVPPSNACVDMYVYTKEITLPPSANGYLLVFQRCCRNKTITNIIDPESAGATYSVKIPPQKDVAINSSASFKSLPPNFLCVNEKFEYDHSAADIDNDSLVYELYTPLIGGSKGYPAPRPPLKPPYNTVKWSNPYNLQFPLGTNSTFKIDAQTGKLTILPKTIGQFVIGVAVKEYRNGVLIGTTSRDYQFNVLPCQFQVVAKFSAPAVYCKKEITFKNLGTADSFLWDFGVANTKSDTSTALNPVYTFPANGTYKVLQIARSGNCTDSFEKEIIIRDPSEEILAIKDTAICLGDSIYLGANSSNDFYSISWLPNKWLDDNTKPNPLATPQETITYIVTRTYQKCSFTDSVTIQVNNPDAELGYEIESNCDNNKVFFRNTPGPNSRSFWFVDDKLVSEEESPEMEFNYGDEINGKLVVVAGPCSVSKDFSLKFKKYEEIDFLIPNVITPNNDNLNDCFSAIIKESGLKCIPELYIYNRWGELVYRNEHYCWDGNDSRNQKPLPEGTYFYVMKMINGKVYQGTITLLR